MLGPSSDSTRAGSFSHGSKQLWHTCDRPKEEVLSKEGLTGDQSPAFSGGGESLLDEWSRDGHRWRLGAGPFVVQKTEDGRIVPSRISRRGRQLLSSDLVYTGEFDSGLR